MQNEQARESRGDNHDEDALFGEFIRLLNSEPDYVPPTLTRTCIRYLQRIEEHFTSEEYWGLMGEFRKLAEQPDLLRRPRPIRDAAKCLLSKPANLAEVALLLWLAALLLLVGIFFSRSATALANLPMTFMQWLT